MPEAIPTDIEKKPDQDRLANTAFLIAIVAIFLVFFVHVVLRITGKDHHSGDFRHFYYAARALLDHTDLYTSGTAGYLYPPLIAFLYTPIARLPYTLAGIVAVAFNTAFGITGVLLLTREFVDRFDAPKTLRFINAAALLGVLLNFDKIRTELQMFQTNALMFFMFVLTLRWLDRKPLLAGLPLGLIFNIKYLSLAMLPWLIFRRRWWTAIAFIFSAIGFALLPAVISGWKQNLHDLQIAYGGLLHMVGIGTLGAQQANVEDIAAWFSCSLTSTMARTTLLGLPMKLAMICSAIIALITLGVVIMLYRREKLPLLLWPRRKEQLQQPWKGTIGLEFVSIVAATLCFSPQTNTRHLFLVLLVTVPSAVLILGARKSVPRYVVGIAMLILLAGFTLPRGDGLHGNQLLMAWVPAGRC